MAKYQHILLTADLIQRDDDPVSEKALDLSQSSGAKLTVLHVLEHHEYPYGTPFVSPNFKQWQEELRKIAQEKLDKLCQKLNISKEQQILESGPAKNAILDTADKIGANLIVMGNHTGKGKGFMMLGSTADAVLRGSKCDVLAVHVS